MKEKEKRGRSPFLGDARVARETLIEKR